MNATTLTRMLLAPWHQRDRSQPWLRRIVYTITLAAVVASVVLITGPVRWLIPAAIGLVVMMACWMAVAGNLLEQNHPHAARLVPGHRRAVQTAALIGWAGCSLLPVLLAWALLPGPVPLMLVLLGSSAMTSFLLRSTRNMWLWLWLPLAMPLLAFIQPQLFAVWDALAALWQAHDVGLLLLALAVQVWLVLSIFGRGDAAHQAGYANLTRMRKISRQAMEGRQTGMAAFGRPGEWVARPFERLAAAWLRRKIGLAAPREASAMDRAEIVLHGQQHWLRQTLVLVVILSFVTLIASTALLTGAASTSKGLAKASTGIGIGLISTGLNPAFALPFALWHSRREQALLRLLPGMPLGARLNRSVARRQLRQFLCSWLITALFVLPIAWLGSNAFLAWTLLTALPVAAFTLTRAPATMARPTALVALLPAMLFLMLGGTVSAVCSALELSVVGQSVTVAVVIALTAVVFIKRWRLLSAAPMALPAGRLA